MNTSKLIHIASYIVIAGVISIAILFKHWSNSRGQEMDKSNRFDKESKLVLSYFQSQKDSLKLEAAEFILENARYHSHSKTLIVDKFGEQTDFNVYDFKNGIEVEHALATLLVNNTMRGYSDWDIEMLNSNEIIENIELAFIEWKTKPWAEHISFNQFCEYILPHRAYYEPLEEWRPVLNTRYEWVKDSVLSSNDPIEACKLINSSLSSWLKFDWERGLKELNSQSISEIIQNKHGKCTDLVTMATCAMRSQGIPTAIDFVPHWAHRNSGHSWNVVLSQNGKMVSFAGAEENPGNHKAIQLYSKVGKIYRHKYAKQPETLASIKSPDDLVPSFFNKFNIKDVTKQYIPVGDIEISNLLTIPTGIKYVYLCTYNSASWKPIHWAKLDSDSAVFKDMDNNNVLYLPAYFQNGQIIPAGSPFLFSRDNEIIPIAKTKAFDDLNLKYYNKIYDETIGDGTVLEGLFMKDTNYTLSYWNGIWQPIGTQRASDNLEISFLKVPKNTLLRIESPSLSNTYQRPFTITDGEQLFW